jgi:hypothetical protein
MLTALFVLMGLAFSQGIFEPIVRVHFDDEAFDYFDKEEAYIHLSRTEKSLIITINDVAEGGLKVEFDEIKIPETFAADEDEEDWRDKFEQDHLRLHAGVDVGMSGVEVKFKGTDLMTAETWIADTMTSLNFSPVQEDVSANTLVYDCGCNVDPGIHMRVVLTRIGRDMFVHFSPQV